MSTRELKVMVFGFVIALFTTSWLGALTLCPGDVNNDGTIDVTDSQMVLDFLFNGEALPPACPTFRADFNGDGVVDITDATAILAYAYAGGPPPAACDTCFPLPDSDD